MTLEAGLQELLGARISNLERGAPSIVLERDEDVRATLAAVLGEDNVPAAPPGQALACTDERLHALLAKTDARARAEGDRETLARLTALYRRMLDREAHAWGPA